MSRIDEAMRRSGRPFADSPASTAATSDVFVSPWVLNRDGGRREPADDASITRTAAKKAPDRGESPAAARPAVRLSAPREFQPAWRPRLAVNGEADPLLVHQFRRLAATLVQAQGTGQLKTLMVTSASPGDGKTLTALNLALVLSESYGRRVLLVEGDLRRPAICTAAGLPVTGDGLSDVIKSADERKVALVALTELLTLMPAGRPDPNPLSGLTSERLERLIREASSQFEWVIVDTPPLAAAPDASLMAPLVDGVLLVIRAGQTPHAIVQHAIETLGSERILGVVLNGVGSEVAASYDDYYGHYAKS
jgi:capsular exopolysaccharide synthesis family protein